ncbi:MAG: hypothetical protein WAM14_10410 [Candidatus Nitrosopolaris sp.]
MIPRRPLGFKDETMRKKAEAIIFFVVVGTVLIFALLDILQHIILNK